MYLGIISINPTLISQISSLEIIATVLVLLDKQPDDIADFKSDDIEPNKMRHKNLLMSFYTNLSGVRYLTQEYSSNNAIANRTRGKN
jgi:hypothetical protein